MMIMVVMVVILKDFTLIGHIISVGHNAQHFILSHLTINTCEGVNQY